MTKKTPLPSYAEFGVRDAVLSAGAARGTDARTPLDGLRRCSPEETGASSGAILDFLSALQAQKLELHSLMIYRRGAVIAEGWWTPYRPELPHMQHSLTKSFMITAVGLALAEGRFSLGDKVVTFFPEKLSATVTDYQAQMTVRDLATMQSGARHSVSGKFWRPFSGSWIEKFFEIPLTERPGTKFLYSSAPSYMLSAIVQKTTGQTVHDYLRPRLFGPLGISELSWDISPEGINPGGNGLSCLTSDLVKLGAVHLQHGEWEGRQVIPSYWVAEALSRQVSFERHTPRDAGPGANPARPEQVRAGYGYHWWLGPRRAAFASGAFGQYSIVLPEDELVIAVTAAQETGQDSPFLPLVWEYAPKISGNQDQPARTDELGRKTAALTLLSPPSYQPSPRMSVLQNIFDIEPNQEGLQSVRFEFHADNCRFLANDERGRHEVQVGLGRWAEGQTTMTGHTLHHEYEPPDGMRVAAFGAWRNPDTFQMTWQFNESAFRDTVTCRIVDDRAITLDRHVNINTGPLTLPTMRGTARPA